MIPGPRRARGAAGPIPQILILIVLIHTAGTFFYGTIWRTIFAADFDVNDFKAYYAGALALSEGRRDLLYPDPATLNLGVLPDQPWVLFAVERGVPRPSGYIYPPFLAAALRPLTALPYHRANQVWFLLNGILFAGSVALLASWRRQPAGPLATAGVLFVCLNFYPTYRAFQCGQVSLLMLFLLAASFWLLERGQDAPAGVAVGLAAAVKMTPAILILYFLVTRRFRAAGAALLAGAGALLVSLAGAGWPNHVFFAREMIPALSRGAVTYANQSVPGFLSRLLLDSSMNVFEFVDEPAWLRLGSRLLSAAILLAALAAAARLGRSRNGAAPGFALVVLAALAASPISWEHHYTLALIPLAYLVTEIEAGRPFPLRELFLVAAGYGLISMNAYDLIRRHLPSRVARVAIAYALFGALVLAAVILMRGGDRAEGEPA